MGRVFGAVRRYANRLVWVIIFSAALQPSAATSVLAQTSGWSQPVALGEYWFPDVAVDPMGRVHVVWSSGVIGYDIVMYAARREGDEWTTPNDIAARPQIHGGSEATRPRIVADMDGFLHLTYRDVTVFYSRVAAEEAHNARAWSVPIAIDEGYFSDLAVDKDGRIHLVYTKNVVSPECPICYHVFYVQSRDGVAWSREQDISQIANGSAKPKLLVTDDHLHVVWEAGPGGSYGSVSKPSAVMYATSPDAGETWSFPLQMGPDKEATPETVARNIAIGHDAKDNLLVVWWLVPDDTAMYQLSPDQGRTWSAPRPIPGVWGTYAMNGLSLDTYSLAADSSGHLHLVMVGRVVRGEGLQKAASVLHVEWDGEQWSSPQVVASYNGDMPEWPRIAVGNGNQLHVVWFVRDEANIWHSDSGRYMVWYATAITSAPYVDPIEHISSTELVVPAAVPTIVEEAIIVTPTPRLDPALRELAGEPVSLATLMSEHDDVLLLIKSLLLPVVVLVGIAVFTVRHRRNQNDRGAER